MVIKSDCHHFLHTFESLPVNPSFRRLVDSLSNPSLNKLKNELKIDEHSRRGSADVGGEPEGCGVWGRTAVPCVTAKTYKVEVTSQSTQRPTPNWIAKFHSSWIQITFYIVQGSRHQCTHILIPIQHPSPCPYCLWRNGSSASLNSQCPDTRRGRFWLRGSDHRRSGSDRGSHTEKSK